VQPAQPNAFLLGDSDAPFRTLLRIVRAHCHPAADTSHSAYDHLIARAADPTDDDMPVFKDELRQLLRGGTTQLPERALETAVLYDEDTDLDFLRRLWHDLYGSEPT